MRGGRLAHEEVHVAQGPTRARSPAENVALLGRAHALEEVPRRGRRREPVEVTPNDDDRLREAREALLYIDSAGASSARDLELEEVGKGSEAVVGGPLRERKGELVPRQRPRRPDLEGIARKRVVEDGAQGHEGPPEEATQAREREAVLDEALAYEDGWRLLSTPPPGGIHDEAMRGHTRKSRSTSSSLPKSSWL